MELQTFIETTIKQIAAAINKSSQEIKNESIGGGISDLKIMDVEFDIAVSASLENGSQAEGKITVLNVFGIGGKVTGSEMSQNTNRIKFTVPLRLKTLGETNKFPVVA